MLLWFLAVCCVVVVSCWLLFVFLCLCLSVLLFVCVLVCCVLRFGVLFVVCCACVVCCEFVL